jgi:hypothetical protein
MNEKTQNQPININIYRDGELAEEYLPVQPSHVEAITGAIGEALGKFTGNIALQARMATYDALHGTGYRSIRNQLVRENRNKAFEAKIGLIAVEK